MEYDVLLIYAEHYYFSNQMARMPEVTGLGILSALSNAKSYKTKLYQGEINQVAKVLETQIRDNKVKVVGFYYHFYNQSEVCNLARYIKENYDVKIIVGGPQTWDIDRDFFLDSLVDAAILGEGEISFLELLDYYLSPSSKKNMTAIKGIAFLAVDGTMKITSLCEITENLDELPFPNSADNLETSEKSPHLQMLTGRGCPFSCAFCHEGHMSQKVRYRSIPNVITELEKKLSQSSRKYNFVRFYDDTFTLDLNRLEKICQELLTLRKKYDFIWYCEGHVLRLTQHPEMIDMMLEAGLTHLQIGVESGVEAVLKKYNKRISLEEIEQIVNICAKKNLQQLTFNILFGGALETEETILESTQYALKLLNIGKGMVEVWPVHYMPFPSTPMTKDPKEYGISICDAKAYTSMQDYPVVETETLSRERIFELSAQFKIKINKAMQAQILDIPFERALNFYRNEYLYASSSIWYGMIAQEYHKNMFFTRIVYGSKSARSLSNEEIIHHFPMRTVLLNDYDGEGFYIHHYRLSALESAVLLHSAGKISVNKIAQTIYPEFGHNMNFDQFNLKVIDIIRTFDFRYWITLSRF